MSEIFSKAAGLSWPLMENNITREDLARLVDFLKSEPRLTQSGNVEKFEAQWSEWIGVRHSVFVNSGSSANLLTLAALRELYGTGEVIVPPLTWVSDIAAVLHCGFKPVFADIDPRTLGLAEEEVIRKINDKTRAVFLTHILGYNAISEKLLKTLEASGVALIEDACESHGATFRGRRVGSFGLVSNFSFYYAHHLSTIEGGMVSTNDEKIYETVRMMRSHGLVREIKSAGLKAAYGSAHPDLEPEFIFAFPAYNVRSTEINAVLGLSQLARLDANIAKRNRNMELFLKGLDPAKYRTDFATEGMSNYAFTLVLQKTSAALAPKVMETLRDHGVEFRRGASGGGNQLRQPYLKKIFGAGECLKYPETEHIHFNGFYIGNYPDLEESKIGKLCGILNGIG